MPYIITTYPEPTMAPGFVGTRRAVATLEEAREAAYVAARHHDDTDDGEYETAAHRIDEAGGTVGPLPDGTVIEVTRVAYNWVAGVAEDGGAELSEDASCAEILAAFNAEAVR